MTKQKWLIVGLGNPGQEYVRSRHNAGFLFADAIASRLDLSFHASKSVESEVAEMITEDLRVVIAKPTTYMNASGRAVSRLIAQEGLSEHLDRLIVAYDDLDLEIGEYKLQQKKFPKVHNGIHSVIEYLGQEGFWNLRLGVDARKGDRTIPGHAYVLQALSSEERVTLDTVIQETSKEILTSYVRL